MQNLPRLLYVGDVPVESTVAGSALMYRLLQEYPVSDLQIVEGNTTISKPESRLANVVYKSLYVGSKRLLHTRFVSCYVSYLFLTARLRALKLAKIVKNFQPEAILTVTHGSSWLAAAALAKRFKLPLHLILHDEWPSCANPVLPWLKDTANQQFGAVYRQAQSRLCVSSYMAECYEELYGVKGSVLYPSRAADVPVFKLPADRHKLSSTLVFAYAGSVNSPAYASSLVSLASVLEKLGAHLLIYSPLTEESIKRIGLNKRNVIPRPLIPCQNLISTLRDEADVLFVPMSFEPEHRPNMEISFPSKLTDYTAIGLPLLIWGPPYCSAVRWAKENLGVAEIVDRENIDELTRAVIKLTGEPEYRSYLGAQAIAKGRECFSHTSVLQHFYQSIGSTATEHMVESYC